MANTIQVRRGSNSSLPTLNAGEFGFSTDTRQVYIGDGSNNHELVKQEETIKIDSTPAADGDYSGIVCDGVLGATLAFGDLVYLNTADQRWELADADAEATSGDVQLAIVLVAGADGNTRLLLLQGYVRENDWNFTSYGQALFVSTTAGDMSQTAPSATGDIVRAVGYAGTTADHIYFCPDNTWVELS